MKKEHHQEAFSDEHRSNDATIITVRTPSGLAGDMILAGLSKIACIDAPELHSMIKSLKVEALIGCLEIIPHSVNHISGWQSKITLPHEHVHRSLSDILTIIESSLMTDRAKELSIHTFTLLAEAEGKIHGMPTSSVTFHEVGALDSILDICLSCILYAKILPEKFICSPLPLADGMIRCAHGILSSPAPAVLELLKGIPVYGFSGQGETITPTAIALLKAFNADFGLWPNMVIEQTAITFGGKVFANAPNGAIWAMGSEITKHHK